jgi:hypothetical protein
MAVKLHRCNAQWVKIAGHPCWRVEKALIDPGIDYERVPGPGMPWQRKQRTRLHELTGAYLYPAIEFEDGRVYREESKHMAERIRAGTLFEYAGAQPALPEEEAGPAGG